MISFNNLDDAIEGIMNGWGVPGIAVGVVEGNDIVFMKGYGVKNLETQEPVTSDSVFSIQSISKCFVSTAIIQMMERGNLNLDAPIIEYLPTLKLDDERYRKITIKQILSHTSGFPDMGDIEYISLISKPEYDREAPERYISNMKKLKLVASPGEKFSYSNIAYNILGHLITLVAGKDFECYMKENILIPTGMVNSTYLPLEIQQEQISWPHLRSPEMKASPYLPYHRADAPASFLFTSVRDMCKWVLKSLKKGKNNDDVALLSPSGFKRMWSAVVERNSVTPSLYEYMSLGWNIGHFHKEKTISHGGGGFGWTAFMLIFSVKNIGAVVLFNEESGAHLSAIRSIASFLMGLPMPRDEVSWMVPISKAMADGDWDMVQKIVKKKSSIVEEFSYDPYDLIDLSIQLFAAGNVLLSHKVLNLNIQAFPEVSASYIQQAKLFSYEGNIELALESLKKVFEIDPTNIYAVNLMRKINILK